MPEQLNADNFRACEGQPFVVALDGSTAYILKLASVQEWSEQPAPGRRQPFRLIFINPGSDRYLDQRTYRLEHEILGALDIFLVPLGPGPNGMRYEAIFS